MNMKKSFKLFNLAAVLVLALYSQILNASTTTVTGTIHDPTGQAFVNGTVKAEFVPDPNQRGAVYLDNGITPFTKVVIGSLNNTGVFSIGVTSNSTIQPARSLWLFTVCSKTSAPCVTFQGDIGLSSPQDISTQVNFNAVNISINGNGAPGYVGVAYVDSEVTNPAVGTFYYNSISNCTRTFDGTNWNCPSGGFGVNVLTQCVGVVGDGVTDDSAAINACLALYSGARFYFPPTNFNNNPSYFFASSITPIGNTTVISGGANGWLNSTTKVGSTVLKFAAGVTGIDIQSCGCTIEYISLLGSEGTQNMVNPVLLNFPSGTNLPLFTRNISSIQRAANVLTVTISKVNGLEALTQQVGSTVKISGVVGDTTMNGLCVIASLSGTSAFGGNPTTFTCPQNGANAGAFGAVGTISLPTTGASTADGIHVCNNFVFILHVTIQSFGRHGINADSLPGHGCNSPFSDDLVVRDSSIIGNQGEGFLCDGTDCNAGLLESNAFYYNLIWAVEDQSSLGNSYQANQISNNGVQWAGPGTPATKGISSISRTLTNNSSTVNVVLSVADTFAKLGSCMVIAGVTDASFNTPANQCFFITSFTDSTHYSYIQPGAPIDASSSGGTSRMAKYSEAYLSAGIDSGAEKIATQSPVSSPALYATYVEGGQYCKFGTTALSMGGVGAGCGLVPSATPTSDFVGQFIGSSCPGLGGIICIGAPVTFSYPHDFGGGINFRSGFTTDATFGFDFMKFDSTPAWGMVSNPAGTAGSLGSFHITSQGFGQTRAIFLGVNVPSFGGVTAINAEGTGYVAFNLNSTGTNSGTGGLRFFAGGVGDALVGSIDGTGLGTFNSGVKFSSGGTAQTGTQGTTGTKVFSCTGSFTSGNLVKSDANGNCIDAGAVADSMAALTVASVKNSTTFSNVSGMSWSILANTNYTLNCNLAWTASANTAGPQFQLTGPAAPTAVVLNLTSAVTNTTPIFATANAFSTPVANSGTVTTATNLPSTLSAGIVNGANAGTLTLQAAANGAGTMTLSAGDSCTLHQQ